MSSAVIQIEGLSKLYRLGSVSTGTLSHDLNRWWHRLRGLEDPYAKVGRVNDRSGRETEGYVWALKELSFGVKEGEVLGIVGRNGAGKSTLLKILSRVTAPSAGRVKVRGRIASLLEVGTGFHPELSGRENIYLNGAILGMRRHEISRKLEEIVEFSGCAAYLDTPVKRYSSGMHTRLAFSVSAHLSREILIVDEVLAVGDQVFQQACIRKMEDCARAEGTTVLVVSHNLHVVSRLCSHCIVMEQGGMVCEGPPAEAIQHYGDQVLARFQNTHFSAGPGDTAGDARIRLLFLECFAEEGMIGGVMATDKPVVVEFGLQINEAVPGLRVGFCLHDDSGAIAFSSYHDDALGRRIALSPAPLTKVRCTIPAGILNGGRYWVSPRISAGVKDWLVCRDRSASFETMLTHIQPPTMLYPAGSSVRPGITAPLAIWE
jgi:lipopolysaccharide transport system ATP-binding protein